VLEGERARQPRGVERESYRDTKREVRCRGERERGVNDKEKNNL
jgi:hypothetical protein